MKTLKNEKSKFILFFLMGFIYAGATLLLVKFRSGLISDAFSGHKVFLTAMNILFAFLSALAGIRFNQMRRVAEKNPLRTFDMLYLLIYTTFLCSTMYVFFNGAIMTLLPHKVSALLTSSHIAVNIPIVAILILLLFKGMEKKPSLQAAAVWIGIGIVFALELSVADLIALALFLAADKIKTAGSISLSGWHGTVLASAAFIFTIPLLLNGSWQPAVYTMAVTVPVFIKETKLLRSETMQCSEKGLRRECI